MGIFRRAEELSFEKLGLSEDAYRVIKRKGVTPEELVRLVSKNRTSELFLDERGLHLYDSHWERTYFVRMEIERKLAEAGFVDLKNRFLSA